MAWLPTILTAVVGAIAAFSDPIQAFISENPMVATILGAVATIVAAILKSPIKK